MLMMIVIILKMPDIELELVLELELKLVFELLLDMALDFEFEFELMNRPDIDAAMPEANLGKAKRILLRPPVNIISTRSIIVMIAKERAGLLMEDPTSFFAVGATKVRVCFMSGN